jgi:hypothetical protein
LPCIFPFLSDNIIATLISHPRFGKKIARTLRVTGAIIAGLIVLVWSANKFVDGPAAAAEH